ncbi:hypothetical protein FRC01_003001, partial [Tulasnella sp. 417]
MHQVYVPSDPTQENHFLEVFQPFYDIAEQYRRANSAEEKDGIRDGLDRMLRAFMGTKFLDKILRDAGLPEQVLNAAIETRLIIQGDLSTAILGLGAISTLGTLVQRINLSSDGYIFAKRLFENFEAIASQIRGLAAHPACEDLDIYVPILRLIESILSIGEYDIVFTSPAAPSILRVLFESLLRPLPDNSLSGGRRITYRLLTRKFPGYFGWASGGTPQTILERFPGETIKILSQYSTQYIVKQMMESVNQMQSDETLQEFYEVVRGLLLMDRSMQVNLLSDGKLHASMANAWWRLGGVATLPIRLDDISAAFSWDPVALVLIEDLILAIASPEMKRQVFRDLVNEADLVHLLGRVCATRKYEANAAMNPWYSMSWQRSVAQRLAKLCEGNRNLIDDRIQSDW